jgi:uncharacterized iron-regulated protein
MSPRAPLLRSVFFAILFPVVFLHAQDSLLSNNFKIYDVRLKKEVAPKDIALAMDQFDILFVGEEHNDSVGHFFQKIMLESLHDRYQKNLVLSMEMFDRDVQDVMDEYLQGFIKEKVFIKDARAWNNYSDYRPMIELAKAKGLDVVCTNAPRRYTNLVGREGLNALRRLPEASKKNFAPVPYDTAKGEYYNKLMGLTNHSGKTTDTAKPAAIPMGMGGFNLVLAQSLWDATMAYSMVMYKKRFPAKKMMMVNGRFHSESSLGIVQQISNYQPKLNCLIVTVLPDESFNEIDWNKFKHLGDYIVITNPEIPKTYKDQEKAPPIRTQGLFFDQVSSIGQLFKRRLDCFSLPHALHQYKIIGKRKKADLGIS